MDNITDKGPMHGKKLLKDLVQKSICEIDEYRQTQYESESSDANSKNQTMKSQGSEIDIGDGGSMMIETNNESNNVVSEEP